jgi:hypothetical protein
MLVLVTYRCRSQSEKATERVSKFCFDSDEKILRKSKFSPPESPSDMSLFFTKVKLDETEGAPLFYGNDFRRIEILKKTNREGSN